jgi:hypothetical protein
MTGCQAIPGSASQPGQPLEFLILITAEWLAVYYN